MDRIKSTEQEMKSLLKKSSTKLVKTSGTKLKTEKSDLSRKGSSARKLSKTGSSQGLYSQDSSDRLGPLKLSNNYFRASKTFIGDAKGTTLGLRVCDIKVCVKNDNYFIEFGIESDSL